MTAVTLRKSLRASILTKAVHNVVPLALLAAIAYAPSISKADLLGYWQMNDGSGTTIQDFSANQNDGSLYGSSGVVGSSGSPTFTTGITGGPSNGDALTFGGSGYAKVSQLLTNFSALQIGSSSNKSFTIGMWVYESGSYYPSMLGYANGTSRNFFMQGANYPADPKWYVPYGSPLGSRSFSMPAVASWHYVGLVYTGTNLSCYVSTNGTATTNFATKLNVATTASLSSWGDLFFGADYANHDDWQGKIGAITILNSAANLTEVSQMAQGIDTTQLGYWTGTTGPTYYWNAPSNWGGALPSTRRPLVFDTSVGLTTNSNNFTANTQFAGMQFRSTAGAFTLAGNAVNLTGAVSNASSNTQTIGVPLVLNSGGILNFGNAVSGGNIVVSNGITGATSGDGLSVSGASINNVVTLNGSNTYQGATQVNSGTLLLNGTLPLSSNTALITNSAVTVSGSTAALVGTGTIGGAVTIQSSGTLTTGVNSSTVGSLALSSGLTLNAASLNMKLGAINSSSNTASTSDLINVTGNLTLTGSSSLTLSQLSGFTYGNYDIINYTGSLSGTGSIAAPASNSTYGYKILTSTPNEIILDVYVPPATKYWSGSLGTAWDIATTANWGLTSGGTGQVYNESSNGNDPVVFDDNGAVSAGNINVSLGTTVSPQSVAFNNSTYPIVINDNGSGLGNISGNASLTVNGTAGVTLNAANTFTGDTVIAAGTLTLGNANALAGSSLNYNNQGGSVSFGSLTAATLGGLKGAQNLSLVNSSSAGVILTVGANNNSTQYDGILSDSGAGGGLIKTGAGTLLLTQSATYSGPTTVNNGTLTAVGFPNSSSITVNSGTLNISGTSASLSAVTNNSTLTFTATSGTPTLVSLSGSGTTNFTAGGSIGTASGGTIYFNGSTASIITLNDATVNLNNTTLTVSGGTQTIGSIVGSGTVEMAGTGTFVAGAGSNFSGSSPLAIKATSGFFDVGTLSVTPQTPIDFNGGTVEYTGSANLGSFSAPFTFGSSSGSQNFAINVTNSAATITAVRATVYNTLVKGGAGTLILANSGNQDAGAVVVNAGTLVLAGDSSHEPFYDNCGGITITGGTLQMGKWSDGNFHAGNIYYQSATITMSGGTFDVNGDNADTYPTVGGTAGTITNNGAIALAVPFIANANVSFAGNIVDGTNKIGLNLSGGGKVWTLSGSNTYSGATTINSGTIKAGSNGAFSANSDYTVAGGQTLALNGYADAIGSLTGAGNVTLGSGTLTIGNNNNSPAAFSGVISSTTGGGIATTGTGTLTLTGTNTYNGSTTIVAGSTLLLNGTGKLGSGTGTAISSAGTFTQASTAVIAGASSLSVTGGLTTLNGSNTYSGATSVSGTGTLSLPGKVGTGMGTAISSSATLTETSVGVIAGGSSVTVTAGTTTLNGINSYTGVTEIDGTGLLTTPSLAAGGTASGIGQSPSTATNLVFGGGTLQYTGGGASTDRLFTIGDSNGDSATLDASGTGALSLTNTGSIAFGDTSPHTLMLTGSNTSSNSLGAAIGDNTGATSVVKTGTGSWTLAGASTYSGGTMVSAGTLNATTAGSLGQGPLTVDPVSGLTAAAAYIGADSALASTAAVTVNNGPSASGTIYFNSANPTIGSLGGSGTVNLNSAASSTPTNLTITNANGTVNGTIIDNYNPPFGSTPATGAGSLALTGGTLTLSGANTYTGGTTIGGGTGSATLFANNTTGSAAVSGSTGTGNVTVNSNGRLGGTGFIGNGTGTGAVVTINPGGVISPGASTIADVNGVGTLTTGDMTLVGGATPATSGAYYFKTNVTTASNNTQANLITPGTQDLIMVGGVLNIDTSAGPFVLSVVHSGNLATSFIVANASSTIEVTNGSTVTPLGVGPVPANTFVVEDNGNPDTISVIADGSGTGFDIVVSTPEPGSVGLLGVASLGLLRRRRAFRCSGPKRA